MVLTPFHLAIPVADLLSAEQFYRETLGCSVRRRSDQWIDFNQFGHQLVSHQVASAVAVGAVDANPVDGHDVPVPHFGVVLDIPTWTRLRDRLLGLYVEFVIEPHIRFAGEVGEQATMFLLDPCGNALEFKAVADIEGELFKA